MCQNLIQIKSKNPYNIKKCFAPCGKCEECRRVKKTEWTNRLLIEMDYYQKKYKYKVGFITLTYNEENLPHIPSKYLKDEKEKIPCFNYEDIKKLNNTIHKFLWSKFQLKNGYRHFITCEYGEKYHRPHMHGIILFHPMFTHLDFYQIIEDAWTGTTQHIQNNNKRHTERKCYGIIAPFESFVPKDTHKVGAYVAKYVCKDIEYNESIANKLKDNLTEKEKHEVRKFAPFHRQSAGLSRCILEEENEKELIKQLKEGIDVIGSRSKKELPNYIKERLIYRQHETYNIRTHRYEQIKKYSKTYYNNKKEIYLKKYEQNKKMFERMTDKGYWEKRTKNMESKTASGIAQHIKDIINKYGIQHITEFYTTYYGVKYENCKVGEPHEILFERQNPCADLTARETINKDYYNLMTDICGHILSHDTLSTKEKRNEKQEKTDRIKSYWNNIKQ